MGFQNHILRTAYHNSRYGPQFNQPTYDITFVGIIVAWCILYSGLVLILPSFKMNLKTLGLYSYFTWTCWMGWVITDCLYSFDWYSGSITTETFYAPYDPRRINATIGLYIGLNGFNVTLEGHPVRQFGQTINYNEAYHWDYYAGSRFPYQQGRAGFSHFAGAVSQRFREWQFRGYPLPISDIAEYFTVDAEDIRWGRWFRIAGWYAHIVLWTAVPIYAIMHAMFYIRPSTGGIWMGLTGIAMIFSIIIYGVVVEHLNFNKLQFVYTAGTMTPSFGWSYYLVMFTGIFSVLFGIATYIYFIYHPELNHKVFESPVSATDDVPPVASSHEEEKLTYARRKLSVYGGHTIVARKDLKQGKYQVGAEPGPPSTMETRIDSANKALAAEVPTPAREPAPAYVTEEGDVEMVPMERLLSRSNRQQEVSMDGDEMARHPTARMPTDNMVDVVDL